MATTLQTADLVTKAGFFLFLAPPTGDTVMVEHWPSKPCKRTGFARGATLSRAKARELFKRLKAEAL